MMQLDPLIVWPHMTVVRSGRLLLAMLVALLIAALPGTGAPDLPTPNVHDSQRLTVSLDHLPLAFVPNAGQTDPSVRFQARSADGLFFFTPNEVVLSLPSPSANPSLPAANRLPESQKLGQSVSPTFVRRPPSVVRLQFEGANPTPELMGINPLPGATNYFIGSDPARWHANLPTYAGVVYQQIYPGIDLRYDGTGRALKGTYLVSSGADPTLIRWRYLGAANVRTDQATGSLLIPMSSVRCQVSGSTCTSLTPHTRTPDTILIEQAPVAWQSIDGHRVPVSARYVLFDANGRPLPSSSPNLQSMSLSEAKDPTSNLQAPTLIGFALGPYDQTQPLVLDPTLTFGTYLGGSDLDYGQGIAVDAAGDIYVTGNTSSGDFPTVNPLPGSEGAGFDNAFVVKISASGSLVYSTYLGGSFSDSGTSIAVDANGSVVVTGGTESTDFPLIQPAQASLKGSDDGFVAKLAPAGDRLIYSTYLGGTGPGYEGGLGIALDGEGSAYVAGFTASRDFPMAGGFDDTYGGGYDAFVVKVDITGTLAYSTYLGGIGNDLGYDIAVDGEGNAYVTGETTPAADFPVENALQPSPGGGPLDAFVTKLSPIGNTLIYSTFLGGNDYDNGRGVAVDRLGNAYITGVTASLDFPVRNPLQKSHRGDADAYVAKLNATGSSFVYSTYLGGSRNDFPEDIAVDGWGRAFITGGTASTDFPTARPIQGTTCPGAQGFLTSLSPVGDSLTYSTCFGGGGGEEVYGIAASREGFIYLTGSTTSNDFPTVRPPQERNAGGDSDAFVARITPDIHLLLPLVAR